MLCSGVDQLYWNTKCKFYSVPDVSKKNYALNAYIISNKNF